MAPAGLLPGEDDAVADGPEELVFGVDRVEDAARAGLGLKELARSAGGDVGKTNGPRLAFAMRTELLLVGARGHTEVSEARAVGRPDGRAIAIYAWVEIAQAVVCERKDADKGVVFAIADEGEARAVGGPAQVFDFPLLVDDVGDVLALRGDGEELAVAQEGDAVAFG